MCIIIDRKADVDIPLSQIELACDINKHGFGISWIEKSRIKTYRSLTQPTDPKEVCDQLQRLKKKRVWLHIRHATVGPVSEVNNHPFYILTQEKDGRDLCFMHNGTLWEFDPKDYNKDLSDSAYFAQTLVRPLALRFAAWMPKKSFLDDSLFIRLMCKYTIGESKLVLYDNHFGTLHINKQKGKEYDGYWASNDHLEDKYHQRSKNVSGSKWHNYGNTSTTTTPKITQTNSTFRSPTRMAANLPWEIETENILGGKSVLQSPEKPGLFVVSSAHHDHLNGVRRARFEFREVRSMVETAKETTNSVVQNSKVESLLVKRESFIELTGIQKLEDVGRLSRSQLIEMCDNFPQASAELIIDLLAKILEPPLDQLDMTKAVVNG